MEKTPLNRIRVLIAESELEQAIGLFISHLEGHDSFDTLMAIAKRYKALVESRLQGLMGPQDYEIEESRIMGDLLELSNWVDTSRVNNWMASLQIPSEEKVLAQELVELLDFTYEAFQAQAQVRNLLYRQMVQRLGINERLQYEVFFSTYYEQMNPEELRKHRTIRGYTENVLSVYNQQVLEFVKSNRKLKQAVPRLKELEKHLVIWMGKYRSVFQQTEAMSLVYVGVEENVPFPQGIEAELKSFSDA